MKPLARSLIILPLLAASLYADLESGSRAYSNADYETALKEWMAAARQGDSLAALAAGALSYEGIGGADKLQAVRWLKQAAGRPDGLAEEYLGLAYMGGLGVPTDKAVALDYLWKAASKGRFEAGLLARLASKQSAQGVIEWLQDTLLSARSSCVLHCPEYLLTDELLLLGVPYKVEANKWLDYLYEHGSPYDLWQMGNRLCNGCGLKPEKSAAYMKFYRRSAEKGFAPAQFSLGSLLDQEAILGPSGEPTAEGDFWLARAAEQGDPKAQGLLASHFAFLQKADKC